MRIVFFLTIILFFSGTAVSQKKEPNLTSDENFKFDSLSKILLNEINRFRQSKNIDSVHLSEMLQFAGELSAEQMSSIGNDKIDRKKTLKNLKKSGATKRGEEITMKASIGKGNNYFKTEEVAKVIYNRWENNPKTLPVLLNPKLTLAGISCALDEAGKKIYVSAVFGGYDITNGGVIYRKQLAVPFNTRSKKIKSPELRTCKTCEHWRNYDILQKGLYVMDGKIYLKYQNTRDLRRIIKKAKDGLAVDVVQRSQYIYADYNIVDNNLSNKGLMSKIIYRDKFFKKNILLTKDKKANRKLKSIEIEMGKFNNKITGSYEINLIVVQDGKICKTITRGYVESGDVESNTPVGLMPAINSKGLKPAFEPRSEGSIITMTIPFEKNKSEFKQQDIAPFIQALNEPDFVIDGLYIYAYASIEGDSATNAKLQYRRAESVAKVLQSFQKNKITPSIQTKDSWNLFMFENEDGKYADLVKLGKQKAIAKINSDNKLKEALEPLLAKERFARIVMDITYDLSGEKEKKFSTVAFNRAVKVDNKKQAHKVMEFIAKRVAEGRYPAGLFDSLKIDPIQKNVELLNNRQYYKYQQTGMIDEEDYSIFKKLIAIDPSNAVLQYNKVFCELKLDSNAGKIEHQVTVQQIIDGLYGKLDSNYVNGLNIEWQFKILETLDTLENSAVQVDACISRIKSFYKIKDASWQNGLKLAYVFSRAKDYNYSATVLEPYLKMPKVPENLLFMYISAASRVQEKYYSRTFAKALELAKEINPERYCKLFGAPLITFQVLENPEVKKVYQNACGN